MNNQGRHPLHHWQYLNDQLTLLALIMRLSLLGDALSSFVPLLAGAVLPVVPTLYPIIYLLSILGF